MRSARIGDRFEHVGETVQAGFAQQGLGLLMAQGRKDTLACDTLHERLLLERRVGLIPLSSLLCEAPLNNNSQALNYWQTFSATVLSGQHKQKNDHEDIHVYRCPGK